MKIYVLLIAELDSACVVGTFSSRALAEKSARKLAAEDADYEVQEFELHGD